MNTREQKLNFLKGLMSGKNSISELIETPFKILTGVSDAKEFTDMKTGKIYSIEEIERFKKRADGFANYLIIEVQNTETVNALKNLR